MLKKLIVFALILGAASTAWAEGSYSLKETTPAVQQAISQRQARFNQLQALKSAGSVGEDNQGYVKAFDASAQGIATAENRDRRTIYEAIVEQNNLGSENLRQVEQIFAEVQREKARPGERVQTPSGGWIQK